MVDLYPLGTLPGDCRDGSFATSTKYGTVKNAVSTNVPFVYNGVFGSTQETSSPGTNPLPKYGSQYY
jgi:hypothetical protein